MHLSELLAARAHANPDAVALEAPGASPLSYTELVEHVERIAGALNACGIGRADRVAIVLPNGPEMALAVLSVSSAAIAAPLNPACRQAEFEFFLSDLGARALLTHREFASPARAAARSLGIPIHEADFPTGGKAGSFRLHGGGETTLAPAARGRAQDVALVLHTSGTTSRPKSVPLTHANLLASAANIARSLQLTPADRCLNIMPLFHIHGLAAAVLASLYAGGQVVCTPGFLAPRFFDWLDEFRPTWYTAVPTMHQAILARAADHREIISRTALRLIRSSSASLPPPVMAELERTFNAPAIEAYGMTEAAHQMASNPLPPRPRQPGSVGIAAGPEIAIMDQGGRLLPSGAIGEIVIRGTNVTHGYEHDPEANVRAFSDGWFRTGDQGYLDAGSYLFITGRLKELINRGGEKISPRRVEDALLEHPAVAQAVAFSIPDDRLGEDVAAAVVLRAAGTVTERELRDSCALRLVAFEVPRRVVFLDELPKGATGKLQRIGLAQKLGLAGKTPSAPSSGQGYVAPRTPLEIAVAALWADALGVPRVGAKDDFIHLGGDSILAAQLISRVRDAFGIELPLISLFEEAATVQGMAELATRLRAAQRPGPRADAPIGASDHGQMLSFVQERFWFRNELEPGSPVGLRSSAFRLRGALDAVALKQSLDEIVRRHAILRTRFVAVDGVPFQHARPPERLALTRVDLRAIPEGERTAEAQRAIGAIARTTFDLRSDLLVRACLLELGEQDHILLIVQSHIASDGWSDRVLVRELGTLYNSCISGQPSLLLELPLQYADYAREQRAQIQGPALDELLRYWKRQFEGELPTLDLPTDRRRPAVKTTNGARYRFAVPKTLLEELDALGRGAGATRFMTLLAAFQTLLCRYSGREQIVVGVPIASRDRTEWEGLIGCFMNTLALHTDLAGNPTFRELLGRVRGVALGAFVHHAMPFQILVHDLQTARGPGHTSLFQVLFQLRNLPPQRLELDGLEVDDWQCDPDMSEFDLALDLEAREDGLRVSVDYSTDLFDLATIERMGRHLRTLLTAVVRDADVPLASLPLLTDAEQQQILVAWNDTRTGYPNDQCLHHLIEAQAELTPDAIAVVFQDRPLRYRELNERANQLAHHLVRLGITPETCVGIAVERGLDTVVGLLGILKAGGAYVPLDPNDPRERLQFVVDDTRTPVLLTDSARRGILPEYRGQVVCLDADRESIRHEPVSNPRTAATGANLAYVIHTSGSTGKPNGVLTEHSAVVNVLLSGARTYGLTHLDRILAVSSVSFDASVFELFLPLLLGGTVILADRETTYDGRRQGALISASGATVIAVTPTLLRMLLDAGWGGSRAVKVICGGEALDGDLAARALDRCGQLWNSYGPTETTIESTAHHVAHSGESSIIGRPHANTTVFVLDGQGKPQPIGIPGELYIGGTGVARGYLNRPELTAERFIPDPFGSVASTHASIPDPRSAGSTPGPRSRERLYKTGDRARFLADGNLQFLGRTDTQVKLRGYRIELGEIEAVLARHPEVAAAVVLLSTEDPQNRRLVAYIVPTPHAAVDGSALRQFLVRTLPEYMVPSAFIPLDRVPYTQSGKLDRRALSAPAPAHVNQGHMVEPRTPTEIKVAAVWAQVLHLDRVGANNSFFELGGDSLLAIQVVSRLRDDFEFDIPLRVLFEARTLADLAARVDRLVVHGKKSSASRPVPLKRRAQRAPR